MTYLDTRDLIETAEDPDTPEEERADILALLDEIGDEAPYGVTLIPVDEFEDYARYLAEDIGAVNTDYSWPSSHIDWDSAAEALAQDYTLVTFQGTDYYYR